MLCGTWWFVNLLVVCDRFFFFFVIVRWIFGRVKVIILQLISFISCRCNFIAESVCNLDILHANVGGFSLKELV